MKKAPRSTLAILWLWLIWVNVKGNVDQSPPTLTIQEGKSCTLHCNYSSQSLDRVYWYRQEVGKSLKFIFALYSNGAVKQEERLTATFNTSTLHSSLSIRGSQPEDSGTYLCAASIGGSGNRLVFGAGTKVRVTPDIKDPQPALYQLTSPKSSDTSVCLLTDFDSSNTYTNGNDSTVLEMMTMESKSYGAVAWGSKSSFNCTNAFPQNIINLTQPSGSTCKVQDVEQSFETDKDLNLMNASLIFLRVIFLKTVGFNLLMTLRLWSN